MRIGRRRRLHPRRRSFRARRPVLKAYPSAITPIDEVWARTGTDEMLIFTFEDGRVHAIVLGPPIDPEDLEK